MAYMPSPVSEFSRNTKIDYSLGHEKYWSASVNLIFQLDRIQVVSTKKSVTIFHQYLELYVNFQYFSLGIHFLMAETFSDKHLPFVNLS